MIARLQRFYGGDPMRWLNMPKEVLRSYADNIPSVQSAEMLSLIGVSRIADAGRMKIGTARRAQRTLEKQSEPRDRRPADLAKLQAAGIRVERR